LNVAWHSGPGVINSTAEHPEYHFGTAAPERMTVVSGALVGLLSATLHKPTTPPEK